MAHVRLHHEVVRPRPHHDPSSFTSYGAPYAGAGDTPLHVRDAASEEHRYVLVRNAAPVPADEIDDALASAVEVTVLWGTNVLHVSHLSPPRAFSVGHGASGAVDFVVPPELAPFSRMDIVAVRDGVPHVVAPRGAGLEACGGELRITADDADGGRSAALVAGATAQVTFGALSFRVSSVAAAKRVPRYVGGDTRGLGSSFLATFAAVASFLGTLAYYTPAIGSTLDDGLDREQLATMLAILKADAEQERKVTPSEGDSSSVQGGGTPGTAAKGPEGKMGRPDRPSTQKRFAIEGSGDVVLSRQQLIAEAMNFGMTGVLNSLNGRATPQALWGADVPNGPDATDAWGEMFGESIDESGGAGGLGLSGPGWGAGGYGEQIGIGSIGTCGTNCGKGNGKWGIGPGMGSSMGSTATGHVAKAPSVRAGATTVNGHIPAEVIQRIVRQNYGRFRQCYESGLRANPNLTGRVSARFVIGRDGSVTNVANGGGDLPDSAVTSCVLSAFYGLSFPSPDGGIVTVTYPIMLVPG
jgi:hypothetical protein